MSLIDTVKEELFDQMQKYRKHCTFRLRFGQEMLMGLVHEAYATPRGELNTGSKTFCNYPYVLDKTITDFEIDKVDKVNGRLSIVT